jgi:Zn-dependent peptidase ImmA (M78 family)
MANEFELEINPLNLDWAIRNSDGLFERSRDTAMKSKFSDLAHSSDKTVKIKYSELRNFCKTIKRPFFVMLLNLPPENPPVIKPRAKYKVSSYSPQTIREIRRGIWLEFATTELIKSLNLSSKLKLKIPEREAPEAAAEIIRKAMGLTISEQKDSKDAEDFYAKLIRKIEESGAFVFEISPTPYEISGFSISGEVPIIAINAFEKLERRIFTLLHEYGHLLFGNSLSCGWLREEDYDNEEMWCNKFASEFLVNGESLKQLYQLYKDRSREFNIKLKEYKISKSLVFFRFSQKKYLDKSQYREEVPPFVRGAKKRINKPESNKKQLYISNRFSSLIKENINQDKINVYDYSDYVK